MRGKRDSDELPKWPHIDMSRETNECRVHGKHITYPRLLLAEKLTMLLLLGFYGGVIYAFFFAGYEIIRSRSFDALVMPFFVTVFGGTVVLGTRLMPRILCRLFFPRQTSIRFTTDAIFIGRKRFDIFPDTDIQFRAGRPHLPDEKYIEIQSNMQMKRPTSNAAYKLKFRKIEMVYGSRLIHITSIADQDRAEQVALMLQFAYLRSRLEVVEEQPAASPEIENEEFGDMLPE